MELGNRQYEVVWVSPVDAKWRMTDGGWFTNDPAAVRWAKGLQRLREHHGVSKGTLFEKVPGKPDRVVTYVGSRL